MIRPLLALFLLLLLVGCSRYSVGEYPQTFQEESFPLQMVVVDAGHGGDDPGCQACDLPIEEKELTLQVAFLLKAHLQKLGYRVVMTRTTDLTMHRDKRVRLANELNPALFVSVHFNHADSTQAEGVEVYYSKNGTATRIKASKDLAERVLQQVLASAEAKSRGVKTANYRVIKNTTMPAVLVEVGFLSNLKEAKRCRDPVYLDAVAWGIAKGVHQHLSSDSLNGS